MNSITPDANIKPLKIISLLTAAIWYNLIMRERFFLHIVCMAVFLLLVPILHAEEDAYVKKRQHMVDRDIKGRGVKDPKVLDAMLKIPRQLFVDDSLRSMAYADHPLPIGDGQTISQPYVVALMTEALRLKPTDRVLEIGTGSGYQAAVLAEIVKEVYTIEIRKSLADKSTGLFNNLGYKNVKVKYADGYFGWEEYAPFDAIIITASANHIPPPLLKQLKKGGRLIVPVGSTVYAQMLTLVTRKGDDFDLEQMTPVAFVPMTGEVQKGKQK